VSDVALAKADAERFTQYLTFYTSFTTVSPRRLRYSAMTQCRIYFPLFNAVAMVVLSIQVEQMIPMIIDKIGAANHRINLV